MSATILIVEDEDNARENLSEFFNGKGYEVVGVPTLQSARQVINQERADIILLDVRLPDGYGPQLLEETATLPVRPPIILITAFGEIDMAVDAMKNGAHDFITKPLRLAQLEKSVARAAELVQMRRELAHFHDAQAKSLEFVLGDSPVLKKVYERAARAAAHCVSVLITGPTGTGKDVLAHFIHQNGPRAKKAMMPLNCAAIQPTVVESELFGYEPGAFTGADKRKLGLMETADGGILFLDEISSMPVDVQAKLLRALEEKAIRRVGGNNMIKVDVQIIAASNRDLPKLIEEGKFREDLYYRLKVVDLTLPRLCEHKQDIPDLVGMFIRKFNQEKGLNILELTPRALQAVLAYDWPGNIRELRNTIESAMVFCDDERIDLGLLSPAVLSRCGEAG